MRIVEAYLGEYASGKSENAVARSLELAKMGREVTLVDLDMVEPCYTLRSLQKSLKEQGVHVLAWSTENTFGLGEAGQVLLPAARWALHRSGDIILDIGYGVGGASILNLVEGAADDPDLRLLLVVNFSRPLMDTVEKMVDYAHELGRVDGLIANTHLGEETDCSLVKDGLERTFLVGERLAIPIEALAVSGHFASRYRDFLNNKQYLPDGRDDLPLRILADILPDGFW